jgi:hypothetical protein
MPLWTGLGSSFIYPPNYSDAALNAVADLYQYFYVLWHFNVGPRTELDEAKALAEFKLVAGTAPAYDAPGHYAGDLGAHDGDIFAFDGKRVAFVGKACRISGGRGLFSAAVNDVLDRPGDRRTVNVNV